MESYPGRVEQLSILSYDEQNFLVTDLVEITGSLRDSSDDVSYQYGIVILLIIFQGISISFNPTAKIIEPRLPTFDLHYHIVSSGKIPDTVINSTYSIKVVAFREQSFVSVKNF